MKIKKTTIAIATLAVLVFLLSALLGSQGVSVGDDMGYMFSDSRLHIGDGARVIEPSMILKTQASHFLHFNGRVIVHSVTQLMLMPGMRTIFIMLNSLAVVILWLLCCRTAGDGSIRGTRSAVAMLILLLWLMPMPGVIWFSLAAFAVNYLWGALPSMWLLCGIGKILQGKPIVLPGWICVAIFAGAVQESFSLPLLGGVGALWLITRDKSLLWIFLALGAGSLALLLAPGNYAHAQTGGGFALSVLAHKSLAMLREALRTPLPLLAAIFCLAPIRVCRKFLKPEKLDILLLLCIVFSLLLGSLSFTSLRQLSFPSIIACVELARIGKRFMSGKRKSVADILLTVGCIMTLGMLFAGFMTRSETKERMSKVEKLTSSGKHNIWIDCSTAGYNGMTASCWPINRMDDDPFGNDLLHIVFDSNTRKGLKRLYSPEAKSIPEILPLNADSLHRAAAMMQMRDTLGVLNPRRLDNRYSLVIMPITKNYPELKDQNKEHIPFASVRFADTLCLIIPAQEGVVISIPRRKAKK